jgi:hypothetical protein
MGRALLWTGVGALTAVCGICIHDAYHEIRESELVRDFFAAEQVLREGPLGYVVEDGRAQPTTIALERLLREGHRQAAQQIQQNTGLGYVVIDGVARPISEALPYLRAEIFRHRRARWLFDE